MNTIKQFLSGAALPISIALSVGTFFLIYSEGDFGRSRRSGVLYAMSDLIGFIPTIIILSAFVGCISYVLFKELRPRYGEEIKVENRNWSAPDFISKHYLKIVLSLILGVLTIISVQLYLSRSSGEDTNSWNDSSWGDGW